MHNESVTFQDQALQVNPNYTPVLLDRVSSDLVDSDSFGSFLANLITICINIGLFLKKRCVGGVLIKPSFRLIHRFSMGI